MGKSPVFAVDGVYGVVSLVVYIVEGTWSVGCGPPSRLATSPCALGQCRDVGNTQSGQSPEINGDRGHNGDKGKA